jgi:predicted dehydrogenase
MSVCCENAQFTWDDNDWSGPIRTDRQSDGGRGDIASEDVVRRHVDLAGITEPTLQQLMTPQYAGQDYLLENYRFLQAVAADRPAFPDFETAVYAHRVVDAIYASAREGRPVEVRA